MSQDRPVPAAERTAPRDARGALRLVHAEGGGGPFEPSSIRHLRSTDGGRSFGPSSENSNPRPAGYSGATFPALGTDARGRGVVMWELLQGLKPYGLAMAVSENGLQFSTPQLIPGSADPAGRCVGGAV